MLLQEFLQKYNGKYVEVAGSSNALNQCVDLANAYIRDVLGLPIIEWTNAVDFPSKGGDNYDYIKNTPTNIPKEGDLVIWGGTYGHIAIFLEGDANTFRSFDQNWPTGKVCFVTGHTYANVLGWMRKKPVVNPTNELQVAFDQCRIDRDTNHNDRMALYEELGFTGVFNRTVAVEEIKKLKALEKSYVAKDEQLKVANDKISTLEEKIEQLRIEHAQFASEASKTIQDQGLEIQSLSTSIQELKKTCTAPQLTGWKLTVYEWLTGGK